MSNAKKSKLDKSNLWNENKFEREAQALEYHRLNRVDEK
jgi:hypothetical protein